MSYIRSNDHAGAAAIYCDSAYWHAADSCSFSFALATDDLLMGSCHLIESDGIGSDCQMRFNY